MLSREQAGKDDVRSEPSHVRSQLVLVGHWATPEISCTLSLVSQAAARFQAIHGVQEVPWAGEGSGTRISV